MLLVLHLVGNSRSNNLLVGEQHEARNGLQVIGKVVISNIIIEDGNKKSR